MRLLQVECEGTAVAAGYATAMCLAYVDDERVEFVVMTGKVFGLPEGAFRGEGLVGEGLNVDILCVIRDEGVTDGDAAQVFIDDHGWDIEGVEENRIGGFGTDAGEGEEVLADCRSVKDSSPMQCFDLAGVMGVEKGDEGFERGRLAQHETGRADEIAEFGFGDFSQASDGKDAACFEIGDGTLDAFPGGVLGKVGADDDFEDGPRRPPLLWAESFDEMVIHGAEPTSRITERRGSACDRITSVTFRRHAFDLRIS